MQPPSALYLPAPHCGCYNLLHAAATCGSPTAILSLLILRTFADLQLVRQLMDEAVADGFTVLRAWATAVDPQYSLQPSPGNFSEPIFRGLDYVLDQARQRNLKVRP